MHGISSLFIVSIQIAISFGRWRKQRLMRRNSVKASQVRLPYSRREPLLSSYPWWWNCLIWNPFVWSLDKKKEENNGKQKLIFPLLTSSEHKNWNCCRRRGLVVRSLDLWYGDPEFKSSFLAIDGFVFGAPQIQLFHSVNSPLVSLQLIGILKHVYV